MKIQEQMNILYVLGNYLLVYNASIEVEIFSCEDYDGIIFLMEDARYQLINNYHMGPRLVINPWNGGFQDMPFKPDTFWLLPPGVQASQLSEERFTDVGFTHQ